jgi:hypothetical protein
VERPDSFFRGPRLEHLPMRVTQPQQVVEPLGSFRVEAFLDNQRQFPFPIVSGSSFRP